MFLFLRTDSIDEKSKERGANIQKSAAEKGSDIAVRRPYRGIQIKEDTYSSLSVIDASGDYIPLVSESEVVDQRSYESETGLVNEYSDFILQAVEDVRQEKTQIIDTFGLPYIYFYGEKPRFTTFQGVLVSSEDFNWRAQFWDNYEKYFRGTKLVQRNARAYISYDSIVIEGYPVQAQASDNAEAPNLISFSLTMFVTNYFDYTNIGDVRFPGYLNDSPNVAVLNQQLAQARDKYSSTTADVRFENLKKSFGQTGGLIKNVARGINDAKSKLGGLVDSAHDVISGRAVRMPIGIAGYFTSVGAAQVAGGSLGSTFEYDAYDSATGNLETLTGSVKLRMPRDPEFLVPNIIRGFKSDNTDEYPLAQQPSKLADLLTTSQLAELEARAAKRVAAVTKEQEALALWNTLAEKLGVLDTVGDVVDGIKTGFAMITSGAAFTNQLLGDPAGTILQTFQLGVYYDAATQTVNSYKNLYKYLAPGNKGPETKNYLGANAGSAGLTFQSSLSSKLQEITALSPDPSPAGLGDVYNSNTYVPNADRPNSLNFEPVYEDDDYSAVTDVSQFDTLDEVFGSSDAAPEGSDVQGTELAQTYGTGVASSQARSPEEILAILKAVLGDGYQTSEDTQGIRGRDDVDVEIEPVV